MKPNETAPKTTGCFSTSIASRTCCDMRTGSGVARCGSRNHTATAVTNANPYGANDHRHPPTCARTPPSAGKIATEIVRTAALYPMRRARSVPSQKSPSNTTARLMSPAEPTPCNSRMAINTAKVGAKAAPTPATPKTTRHGIRTLRRPNRSASRPITGAMTMPGKVAAATRTPGPTVGHTEVLEDVGQRRVDERVGEDSGEGDREHQHQRRPLPGTPPSGAPGKVHRKPLPQATVAERFPSACVTLRALSMKSNGKY